MYRVVNFIKEVEGLKLKPYKDKFGNLTIGYGRNLDDRGITDEEAEYMLFTDLAIAKNDLEKIFPDFYDMPIELKTFLISMMFNLGINRFKTFKNLIQAVKDRDYKKIVYEALNSKRYKQIPDRVEREIKLLSKFLERR